MKYVVKVKANLRSSRIDVYSPKGESEECDAAEAITRFDFLIECGKRGAPVDGKGVALVQIELVTNEPPESVFDGKKNVMLSQYVIDEYPAGPWSNGKAAA